MKNRPNDVTGQLVEMSKSDELGWDVEEGKELTHVHLSCYEIMDILKCYIETENYSDMTQFDKSQLNYNLGAIADYFRIFGSSI